MKVSKIRGFEETNGEPEVDLNLISSDRFFNGGTRGAREHRKHVIVKSVIGRWGSQTIFRGGCWNCDSTYLGRRYQKRKSLLKCPDCGETSFMYKGFFTDRDRYPISEYTTPRSDEVTGTMYICLVKFDSLDPKLAFLSSQKYQSRKNNDSYRIELISERS